MHPYRGIVRTYRRSGGLSKRPDYQSKLTRQSSDTNDAPRDPLLGPVTWNPDRTRTYSTLRLFLRLRLQSVTSTVSTAPLCQEPAHCCIRYPTLAPSSASAFPCWQPFQTGFDSPVFRFDSNQLFFDLIRLNCFSI